MATFNLYEDNKGKVTKESDGVKIYELEQIDDSTYLIKGATMDIGNLFILEITGGDTDIEIIRSLYTTAYVIIEKSIGKNIVCFSKVDSAIEKSIGENIVCSSKAKSTIVVFPQNIYVLEETPTGLLVSTEEVEF